MEAIERLERVVATNFRNLGILIGKRPKRVIITTLIISVLCSLGILRLEEVNNVRTEYSPSNAPSRVEHAVAMNFLGQNGTLDPAYVLVEARDGGSLLRDKYRKALIHFIKQIQNNITIEYEGQEYGFGELCEPYCEMNNGFMAFLRLYDPNNQLTKTYPSIDLFGSQIFIGNNAYGVVLEEGTNVIKSFSTAVIELFISAPDTMILYKWQLEIQKHYRGEEYNLLTIGLTSDCLVSVEVRRMGTETAPVLFGSVCAMILFTIISSFRSNPVKSKPWESLIGSIIPILSMLTSTGILSLCGLRYQSIVVATYFLVLAVGVDDVFIILRAWDLTTAFPETEFIKLSAHLPMLYLSALVSFRRPQQCARNQMAEKVSDFQLWLIKAWSAIVTTWLVRVLLIMVMIAYYYVSFLGILKLEAKISVDKMALPDSYLHNFQFILENALRNMQPITIFVMNPGDLRDPDRLNGIKSLVSEYEHSHYSYGNKSTVFWLKHYEDFLIFYDESGQFTYTEIPAFFKSATYFFLSSFVHMNESACEINQPECISSFFFVTNFHGIIKYNEMIPAVADWRRIAAKYSDYAVYPYSDHSPFVDQTLTIKSTIIWSVLAAFCCTAAACFIFIPNIISIICAVYSVFSISVGIFGLLSHLGVDLDPITMAALLMAIGFSVDFTTHISYHFYKTTAKDSRGRLEEALITIGWPMLQVAISTIVALLPLLKKQSYLSMVFMKTVTITVGFGIFHSLVILPALLTAINTCQAEICSLKPQQKEEENCCTLRKLMSKIKSEEFHSGLAVVVPDSDLTELRFRIAVREGSRGIPGKSNKDCSGDEGRGRSDIRNDSDKQTLRTGR
uniref:SSD domain-containing protein n=1 Tax=Setaria digitata TaxID=48799 RepID=A0A915PYW1_9BILA